MDDNIIYGKTWQEHIENVRKVLQRLQDAGLTIILKKCTFGADECIYLSHRIEKEEFDQKILKSKL